MKIKELKIELKSIAQEIREFKSKRKSSPNGFVPGLAGNRHTYRIYHIAYCLARGRTMEQIEAKVSPENALSKWDLKWIEDKVQELTYIGPTNE